LFQAIRAGARRLRLADLLRIGGITGWIRAAAIAGAAGVEMSTHLYPEVGAHLMRVTETAHWLEWQDWANPILAEPFRLENCHSSSRIGRATASSGTRTRSSAFGSTP
jgi:mandelate racemase